MVERLNGVQEVVSSSLTPPTILIEYGAGDCPVDGASLTPPTNFAIEILQAKCPAGYPKIVEENFGVISQGIIYGHGAGDCPVDGASLTPPTNFTIVKL